MFTCEQCGKQTPTERGLQVHLVLAHGAKRAVPQRATRRAARLPGLSLADLAAQVEQIDAEVRGLITDAAARIAEMRRKNAVLLKQLVVSRRELAVAKSTVDDEDTE